jgi:lambda family phage portal protein
MKPTAIVQANFIDKVVTFVSPESGARRQRARSALAISGAYVGARYDRRQTREWFVSRGSADADTLIDIVTLRPRSRDLVRNAPIATGAVNTVVQNAVGTGLALQPTPDINVLGWSEEQGRAWGQTVGHEFEMWADSPDCDITRTQNFYEVQRLVMRSMLESGDVFSLLPMRKLPFGTYKTCFQIIEADRIHSPNGDGVLAKDPNNSELKTANKVWGGVEVDANGAPAAYHILKRHPGASDFSGYGAIAGAYDRVLAFGVKTGRRNVLHIYDRLRPDQRRGVPYLAPVMELLKQLDRYTEAEIMAAVITAMFTVFVKTETGAEGFAAPAGSTVQTDELELGNGKIVGLAPGEEVQFPNSMRPNAGFDPFVTSILRQIGVALELPFEILIKHFTASYSAARAAMLEAWKFYKGRRVFVASRFCQPVFEAWMDEAVAIGRIDAPGYFTDPLMRRAYLRAEWVGDAPGQIDPQKEADAAVTRIEAGMSTLKKETMELTGQNWADLHPQRAREHQMRVDAGLEPAILNATATEPVGPKPGAPATPSGSDLETAPPAGGGK